MNWPYPYYPHPKLSTLYDLLTINYHKNPDQPAFIFNELTKTPPAETSQNATKNPASQSLNKVEIHKTYRDFYQDIAGLAAYFKKSYRLKKHIAIIAPNSYNYLVTFFAIILSGNVAVLIDKDLDQAEVEQLLKTSDAKIIFYSADYCQQFAKNFLKKYKAQKLESLEKLAYEYQPLELQPTKKPTRPAAIFFTSGTTGAAKGVVLSEQNITADIYSSCSLFRPNGTAFSCLPFHHSFGLVTSVLMPFYYNVPTFLNCSLKNTLTDLEQAQPNTMFVVPAFIETIYKQIWKSARKSRKDRGLRHAMFFSENLRKIKIDLRPLLFKEVRNKFGGNLEYIICGGASLDEKYVKWFRGLGIEILNGYGITECSPVVAVNRNHYTRDGSVGQVGRGVEVKIIDGEIHVKGDIVMSGYYKDNKSTKAVFTKDGYFNTGDFGYLDRAGFLFVTGRKKNLIILSNGENISPEVIESKLAHDPAVSEVVVYEKNHKIIAEVYPDDAYLGNNSYFTGLLYRYNKKVPKNHQVSDIILRDTEFPKNNNKKILRDQVIKE